MESGNNRVVSPTTPKMQRPGLWPQEDKNKWVNAAEEREGTRPYQLSN
jgi:hypothetical protein